MVLSLVTFIKPSTETHGEQSQVSGLGSVVVVAPGEGARLAAHLEAALGAGVVGLGVGHLPGPEGRPGQG